MLHAYILWYGDILVAYGFCALLAFLFRKMSVKKLLVFGILLFMVPFFLYMMFGWSVQFWPEEAVTNMLANWSPSEELIIKETTALTGNLLEQMAHRIPTLIFMQIFVFAIFTGWRAGGLMLIGMALYKSDILSAQRTKRFYLIMLLGGFVLGLPLIIWGINRHFAAQWDYAYSMFIGSQFNYWGSLFLAMGYIAIVMLIAKSTALNRITRPFAAVGRTAFTNYLAQTIICTFIFYGHGLGLFGQVERKMQILIMLGVWILQLIISPIWLKYFKFGPAEWVWRSLTYWKRQPFLVKNASVVSNN
jgi:uncharacterized protein